MGILFFSLEFSMTEQQIPMLIRLIMLGQILMQRFPKKSDEVDTQSQSGDFDNGKHTIHRLFAEFWTYILLIFRN